MSTTPAPDPSDTRADSAQFYAWVSFMHAHSRIMRRLSDDLDRAEEIPLGTYDVLVQLSEAGGRLRLKDLLRRVLLSQPGLSRKVERLESAGLVERCPDPRDGRGVVVAITDDGTEALRAGAVVHMSGIARDFSDHLTADEAEVIHHAFERMLAAIQASEDQTPDQRDQPSATPTATRAIAAATAR